MVPIRSEGPSSTDLDAAIDAILGELRDEIQEARKERGGGNGNGGGGGGLRVPSWVIWLVGFSWPVLFGATTALLQEAFRDHVSGRELDAAVVGIREGRPNQGAIDRFQRVENAHDLLRQQVQALEGAN